MSMSSMGNEMRILNNRTSNIMEAKRMRNAATENRIKIGSQQSDDSTLRYSQASEVSQQHSMLLLKDSERAARMESKIEDLIRFQRETNERLDTLSRLVQEQKLSNPYDACEDTSEIEKRIPRLLAPEPTQVTKVETTTEEEQGKPRAESDDEDDVLFSCDWPVSAQDMFNNARKAREEKKAKRDRLLCIGITKKEEEVHSNQHRLFADIIEDQGDGSMQSSRPAENAVESADLHSILKVPRLFEDVVDANATSPLSQSILSTDLRNQTVLPCTTTPIQRPETKIGCTIDPGDKCLKRVEWNGNTVIGDHDDPLAAELRRAIGFLTSQYSVPENVFAGLRLNLWVNSKKKPKQFKRYETKEGVHFLSYRSTRRIFAGRLASF